MRPVVRAALVVAVAAAAVVAAFGPVSGLEAQQPPGQDGPGFRGDVPGRGGFGLLVMERDMDRDMLMLHIRDRDCDPLSLGITEGGRWVMFVPGAPAFVNRDFPQVLPAGRAAMVTCRAQTMAALQLGEGDAGEAVTVRVRERVRVRLESNPSTGFAWAVDPAPDPGVLRQQGEAFFVPSSELLGAGGVEVFDFVASGAGEAELRLVYRRAFETAPPEQTWTVSVTVTP